jgi:hypothetical protein
MTATSVKIQDDSKRPPIKFKVPSERGEVTGSLVRSGQTSVRNLFKSACWDVLPLVGELVDVLSDEAVGVNLPIMFCGAVSSTKNAPSSLSPGGGPVSLSLRLPFLRKSFRFLIQMSVRPTKDRAIRDQRGPSSATFVLSRSSTAPC